MPCLSGEYSIVAGEDLSTFNILLRSRQGNAHEPHLSGRGYVSNTVEIVDF